MDSKAIEQVTASIAAVSLYGGPAAEAKVIIICADGKEIYLDRATTLESEYVLTRFNDVKYYPDYDRVNNNYTPVIIKLDMDEHLANIPYIPSDLVEKVFRYCYNFAHLRHQPDDLEAFNAQFFMDVDCSELIKLLKVAMRFKMKCLWKRSSNALDKTIGVTNGLGILIHWQLMYFVPAFKPFGIPYASTFGCLLFGDTFHYGSMMGAFVCGVGYYTVLWGEIKDGEAQKSSDHGKICKIKMIVKYEIC